MPTVHLFQPVGRPKQIRHVKRLGVLEAGKHVGYNRACCVHAFVLLLPRGSASLPPEPSQPVALLVQSDPGQLKGTRDALSDMQAVH